MVKRHPKSKPKRPVKAFGKMKRFRPARRPEMAPAVMAPVSTQNRSTFRFHSKREGKEDVLVVQGSNRAFAFSSSPGSIGCYPFYLNPFGIEGPTAASLPKLLSSMGNLFTYFRFTKFVATLYTTAGTGATGEYLTAFMPDPGQVNSTTVPTTITTPELNTFANSPHAISGPMALPLQNDISSLLSKDWHYVSRPVATYGTPSAGTAALSRTQDQGALFVITAAGVAAVNVIVFFEWEIELKHIQQNITIDYVAQPTPMDLEEEEKEPPRKTEPPTRHQDNLIARRPQGGLVDTDGDYHMATQRPTPRRRQDEWELMSNT